MRTRLPTAVVQRALLFSEPSALLWAVLLLWVVLMTVLLSLVALGDLVALGEQAWLLQLHWQVNHRARAF